MELLFLHWPLLLGAVTAAFLRSGHRWPAVAGLVGAGLVLFYGLVFVSDYAAFIFSQQDLFIFLSIYWGITWLVGVLVGTLFARLRRPAAG